VIELPSKTPWSARHLQPGYEFDIDIRRVRWLPFFSEQWFVPRLVFEVKNKGKDIGQGEMSFEIREHDDVSSFSVAEGNFRDFHHIQLSNFKQGSSLKQKLKIESRFIKPGRYMLRVLVTKFEKRPPDTSFLNYVRQKVPPGHELRKPMETMGEMLSRAGACNLQAVQVWDWRWLEIIRVFDMNVCLVFVGSVIIALIAVLATVFQSLFGRL